MNLIKTEKEWIKYIELQELRASSYDVQHIPLKPASFPVIVETALRLTGTKVIATHYLFTAEHAKSLLKYVKRKSSRKKGSSSRLKNIPR